MKCGIRFLWFLYYVQFFGIWSYYFVLCDESKESKRVVFLFVEVFVEFCENVGVFLQYIGLDKEFFLEGGDGVYIGRFVVFWEDDFC